MDDLVVRREKKILKGLKNLRVKLNIQLSMEKLKLEKFSMGFHLIALNNVFLRPRPTFSP